MAQDTISKGADLIAAYVKNLPHKPGVYRMLDKNGVVLYVGKARNLKKRVASYSRLSGHSHRIATMINSTSAMEFVITHTETEALLLEANLIKSLRPRYNVLLRDDKSFPYIVIAGMEGRPPGLFKHRGAQKAQGTYYGPFASTGAVNRTINSLQRAFLLRSCTDSALEGRSRPCLLYQIKRCAAPCTGEISAEDYARLVRQARAFLSGKSRLVRDDMTKAMLAASQTLDFERAALYRDRLAALSHVQAHQGINPQTVEEADVFALVQQGGQSCVQLFFFRAGQNWGNRAYFPKADESVAEGEILSSFLAQFYDNKPIPRLILLSHEVQEGELLREALSMKAGRRVTILTPQRGEKKQLVAQALTNAVEALERRLSETTSQKKWLEAFAQTFHLPRIPRRIEVYDNSHHQGGHAVGAMIVAGEEGFIKNQYRKFNIRSPDISAGDDYAMMREVMERRFARLLKEHGDPSQKMEPEDAFPSHPDVLLIDGGAGQVKIVREVLKNLELDRAITAIGIAKGVDRDAGRERFFVAGQAAFSLPPRDGLLYFIQRLRDEAHRFAIGAHRTRRKKEMTKNPLDEIAGIGATRKRALLNHFGTAKAIGGASVQDLIQVKGISIALAETIHDYFRQK